MRFIHVGNFGVEVFCVSIKSMHLCKKDESFRKDVSQQNTKFGGRANNWAFNPTKASRVDPKEL